MEKFEGILLIIAGQGIILALALISSSFKGKWSNLFLGLIIEVMALEVLNMWGMINKYHSVPGNFPFWAFSSYLLLPPSIYLFGKLQMIPGYKIRRYHLFWFLPAILEIVLSISSYYSDLLLGAPIRLSSFLVWSITVNYLPILATVLVTTLGLIDLARLNRKNRSIQSPVLKRHLIKLWGFYGIISLLVLLWILESIFNLQVYSITLMLLMVFISLIGYLSVISSNHMNLPSVATKDISKEGPEEDQNDLHSIRKLFEEDKIFLQQKLSIKEVSQELGIPQRRLSELINRFYGEDFRRHVNKYRIEEVLRKVEGGQLENRTLLSIALDSGFNSKSAFNQAFKDVKGKNPSAYLKSLK